MPLGSKQHIAHLLRQLLRSKWEIRKIMVKNQQIDVGVARWLLSFLFLWDLAVVVALRIESVQAGLEAVDSLLELADRLGTLNRAGMLAEPMQLRCW
jgi:hypothetical protein